MAFNQQELDIIKFGKDNGKTRQEVERALSNYRNGITPSANKVDSGFSVKETGQDLTQGYKKIGEQLYKGGENIVQTAQDTTLSPFQKVIQGGAQAFRAGSRAFGEGITTISKTILPESTEQAISQKTQDVAGEVVQSPFVQDLISRYNTLDPETKRNIDNALGYAEGLADIATGGAVSRTVKPIVKGVSEGIETGIKRLTDIIPKGKTFKTFDEFINTADNVIKETLPPLPKDATPAMIRARAEAEAPALAFKEKMTGLTPDVKKVIAGKPEKMAEYIDTVNARNLDLKNPSAYEYGGNKARQAVEQMETLVKDTGSDIGSFRQKIGTYQATPDQISSIESSFTNELSKLNLELKNGIVQQIAGKPRKVAGKGDISTLNELYGQIKIIKQSPSLTNLIDVRNLFSKNIDFGKRVGDVSDSLDGLSKSVRARIKDTGATIVGKSEAQRLADYSDFMEALGDIRSFTDRNAGGEYLLRVLLSGRGGEARNIVETIRKYTGVDLTDDAVMMTLVTDMLGNQRQKNLFAQEITKAGVDATRILSGDPSTIMERIVQFAKDKYLDAETVLREASK